ncbi:MAG TPA: NAD(P)-binding domain-containing protein [Reyranella sp.]|nr:NAD(P)-binding domain-containing protein [Reyranella sp.]
MPDRTDVAIIGAGPYGLSIAAHLSALRVPFRIFGRPMENWQNMPRGMLLKSEGYASTLYDPRRTLTLAKYCHERGLGYADLGLPVPLSTFIEYGLAFQRRLVPTLDTRMVRRVATAGTGFQLALEDGETVRADRVVVATGITSFAWMPPALRDLPADKVTHSVAHAEPARLRGADVTVVGGGSSAIDLAALLHEAGARVRLVTRRAKLPVHDRMQLPRPLRDKLSAPVSSIGPGWRSCFFTSCAPIVHRMSAERRVKWVRNELGPAAGWFMASRIAPVPVLHGQSPTGATIVDGRVRLGLVDGEGRETSLDTDHLIVATGYRPDVTRLGFLDAALQQAVATLEQAPAVSLHFESSVPGLYFTGPAAAFSFGPLMRFATGARFAAPRIARHLAATASRRAAPARQGDKEMFGVGARA